MQGGVGGVGGCGGHWGPNCNEPALGGPSLQKVENPWFKLCTIPRQYSSPVKYDMKYEMQLQMGFAFHLQSNGNARFATPSGLCHNLCIHIWKNAIENTICNSFRKLP